MKINRTLSLVAGAALAIATTAFAAAMNICTTVSNHQTDVPVTLIFANGGQQTFMAPAHSQIQLPVGTQSVVALNVYGVTIPDGQVATVVNQSNGDRLTVKAGSTGGVSTQSTPTIDPNELD